MVYFFLIQSVLAKKDFSIEGTFMAHCVECHGANGKVKGEVNLLSFTQGKDIKSDPELLQTVLEVIDFGEMPPEENQRNQHIYTRFDPKHFKRPTKPANRWVWGAMHPWGHSGMSCTAS